MTSHRVTMLLGIVLVSGIVSTQAQLSQVLAVAGDTINKAGEAAMQPQVAVPKNFQRPKNIHSYAQYLKYAGQATGILPIQPEADSPTSAPGPSADSALAPASAMAAMGQPSLGNVQSGFESNYDPSIQDWQKAYQPVDKALNKAFETRITNKNARQVQFELAVAAAPLQMLINDQVVKQGDEAKSFVSGLFGQFGLGGNKGTATDASSIAANPLTGTAVTAPTAEAPAPTAVQGSTVTVANPTASAPAAGSTAAAPLAAATAVPTAATAAAATPTAVGASTTLGARNPLTSLFSFPSFGKRKLLAN